MCEVSIDMCVLSDIPQIYNMYVLNISPIDYQDQIYLSLAIYIHSNKSVLRHVASLVSVYQVNRYYQFYKDWYYFCNFQLLIL